MAYEREMLAKQQAMMNMGTLGSCVGQAQLANAPAPTPLVQQQMMMLAEEIERIHDKLRVLQARLEPTVLSQAPQPACPSKDTPSAYPVGLAESVANLTRNVMSATRVVTDILDRLEV